MITALYTTSNLKLKKFYLNHNSLTNATALAFVNLLKEGNTRLREIGLKWNMIDGEGGAAIADALSENHILKVLDLSWNKLGVKAHDKANPVTKKPIPTMKEGDIGRAWGKFMRDNKSLLHLDLSFNKIGEMDTTLLMEDIVFNQTCIGFHY